MLPQPKHNFKPIAKAHEDYNLKLLSQMFSAGILGVRDTTDLFYREVFNNLSLPAHSKSELHHLDHPFAFRHGSIQPHGHEPEWGEQTDQDAVDDSGPARLEPSASTRGIRRSTCR